MKFYILLPFFLLAQLSAAYSQTSEAFCGTQFNASWETEAFTTAAHAERPNARTTAITYYIPVVVHVIHMGGTENAPDTFVHRLIDELNHKYANATPHYHASGMDVGIQFCLASKDTLGHPTSGITHDSTPASNMYTYITSHSLPSTYPVDSLITRVYGWDTHKYMNIYIVKAVYIAGVAYGGFAYFPDNHGTYRDGLFVGFGYVNPTDPFQYRYDVIAHEAGHYLGLYHTFQFGCVNNNCWTDNDRVCDTPPDNYSSISDTICVHNSCSTDGDDTASRNPFRSVAHGGLGDQDDDYKNYMDYSHCSERFTPGQVDRMRATISTVRKSLLDSLVSYCGIHLSVGEQNNVAEISINPNPFNDEVKIAVTGTGRYSFTLMNCFGSTVYKGQLPLPVNYIHLGYLPQGMYIFIVRTEQGIIKTGKILKQ